MMKKKIIATLLGLVMVLSLLVACGGNGADVIEAPEDPVVTEDEAPENGDTVDAVPVGDVVLEFQQWWGVELPDGFLADLVQEFTDETGIRIELLSNPYADTRTQVMAGAATGTMADVVGLDGAWVYDFASQGAIANLTQLMEESGYDQSQLSDQVRYNGDTYMIPVVNFAYPMYVNMDILAAAGVEDVPTTWSEFQAASEQIIAYDPNTAAWAIPLSPESPSGVQNQFMSWLWTSGGNMLADGRPNLSGNQDLIATSEFVYDLFDSGVVAPGAFAMREPDMVEEFTNGRLAFMMSSLAHIYTIRTGAPTMEFDFVRIPVMDGFTGQSGMVVASWGIGIAENTEHRAEAMQFVEFMMSPDINGRLAAEANAFPGNVHANPDYSRADPLFMTAFEIFQNGFAINEFTGLPISEELMRVFAEHLVLYLDGDIDSAEEMLDMIQANWMTAFN